MEEIKSILLMQLDSYLFSLVNLIIIDIDIQLCQLYLLTSSLLCFVQAGNVDELIKETRSEIVRMAIVSV